MVKIQENRSLKEFFWCVSPRKKESPFTFSTLLFALLLIFLLPLVQHSRSLRSLLQLGHEVLNVVETVIEDPLREGEPNLLTRITARGD